jgi:hydroxymethylglutaryl-CoA reductase
MSQPVTGFSKLSKIEKIDWLLQHHFNDDAKIKKVILQYWNTDEALQNLHDEFIENTVSNYYLPFAVAPNFLINGKIYTVPMTIEESSVVAAASKAAKFWLDRGGFKAQVINTTKVGQVHFTFSGSAMVLRNFFNNVKSQLISDSASLTANMQKRGGGILDIELRDKTDQIPNYYQLHATFETLDAMGANFINSCLEQFAKTFKSAADEDIEMQQHELTIVMSILSNYVPQCLVKAEVSCKVEELKENDNENPQEFVEKFIQAVKIAEVEPYRAVTHNKGIMNGIDAVVLATGNDFRAVEAGIHAYAARDGYYKSLTHAEVKDGVFKFWIEIPLALGTVGGLTKLHPLVNVALQMLGKPSARELMQITAVAGLAQNFAALRSLTTTGIQQGHMKMHLMNILNQMGATKEEKAKMVDHFKTNTVSHSEVVNMLATIRQSSTNP